VRRGRPALSTREALLLAFFAGFVLAAKAALRLHLHVPGHAMFTTVIGLWLARACVPRAGAATTVGALAGLATALLGMGKGGPLAVLRLLLPGLAVDLTARLARRLPGRVAAPLAGVLAGLAGAVPVALVEALAGAPREVVLGHGALSATGKALFGGLGGAVAAALVVRLRAHGLVPAVEGPAA
jgi:hypothetical protein